MLNLLSECHHWPREGSATEKNNKLAPPHVRVPRSHDATLWLQDNRLGSSSKSVAGGMSALGQKQTCAAHKLMSALPPKATVKADIHNRSCPLCPQKQTCAVHTLMSALGHKRTFLMSGPCR